MLDLSALHALWDQAYAIWIAGGWGMLAIAIDALALFGLGVSVWLKLRAKSFLQVPESTWRNWIDRPSERRGPIGALLDRVSGGKSLAELSLFFQGLRATEVAPFERDLRVMKICVGTAPLLGLFGTVTGMLATFDALASGSGGEKTMGLIAQGISEALITTETGLVIALPGLFFHYQLSRQHERYKAFLAHLETVCAQQMCRGRRESPSPGPDSASGADSAAGPLPSPAPAH
ncbi:MAG: MotA/TolQ/ExbB proton channel family protein [Planctomycetota bacterium]